MRTGRIILRALRRTLRQGGRNTMPVTLSYDRQLAPYDPNVQDAYVPAEPATEVVKALVHFISEGEVMAKGLLEMQVSDVIMDFDPEQSFAGMSNLVFIIDGKRYTQRKVGKEVSEFFDGFVDGRRMFRTVVGMLL